MTTSSYTGADIVRLGQEMYERDIRAQVEANHKGRFLALNVEPRQYSLGADSLAALQQAKAESPERLFTSSGSASRQRSRSARIGA